MNTRFLRTIFKVFGAVFVVILVLASIMLYPVYRHMPTPNFPKPRDIAEANHQDLEYLKHLPEVDRSFTPETRAAFNREVNQLMEQAATLDHAALEMGVAKAVALANNGHTSTRGIIVGRNLNVIPLRLAWFQEGLFVVKADPAFKDLLGAKVLTEGGWTPEELVLALKPYVGGTDVLAREFTPYFLISPPALHAAKLLPSPSEVHFTFQLRDESTVERVIATGSHPAVGEEELRWPKHDLSPVDKPQDESRWAHVLDDIPELPLFLRHTDLKYWREDLNNPEMLYVQINSITNQDSAVLLSTFLQEVSDEIARKQLRYVVLDLRFNSGGNYERTADFTKKLPTLLPANGKIFVLTSGNTFSAAIVTAARLKYFGGARVEIVGEQIGDSERHWGEGTTFYLPNSRIQIRYATGYHDWEHGCSLSEFTKCFFLNYIYGVPAGKLSPTIPVPMLFSDYVIGQDSVLNAIQKVIESYDK